MERGLLRGSEGSALVVQRERRVSGRGTADEPAGEACWAPTQVLAGQGRVWAQINVIRSAQPLLPTMEILTQEKQYMFVVENKHKNISEKVPISQRLL